MIAPFILALFLLMTPLSPFAFSSLPPSPPPLYSLITPFSSTFSFSSYNPIYEIFDATLTLYSSSLFSVPSSLITFLSPPPLPFHPLLLLIVFLFQAHPSTLRFHRGFFNNPFFHLLFFHVHFSPSIMPIRPLMLPSPSKPHSPLPQ